jgi:hypothetical protein
VKNYGREGKENGKRKKRMGGKRAIIKIRGRERKEKIKRMFRK